MIYPIYIRGLSLNRVEAKQSNEDTCSRGLERVNLPGMETIAFAFGSSRWRMFRGDEWRCIGLFLKD